jgi:hypothetical protein
LCFAGTTGSTCLKLMFKKIIGLRPKLGNTYYHIFILVLFLKCNLKPLILRNLDNNALGCECTTVESLFNVQSTLSAGTQCHSPTAVQGALFSSSQAGNSMHFSKMEPILFQCSKSFLNYRTAMWWISGNCNTHIRSFMSPNPKNL